jgi:sec-independent protein translocase protein TatB
MFNIFSWQHILILVVIALVVVGPKDLPRLMRMMASWINKGRAVMAGLKRDFVDMTGTNELDGLRAEITALKRKHPLSSLEAGISGKRPSRG